MNDMKSNLFETLEFLANRTLGIQSSLKSSSLSDDTVYAQANAAESHNRLSYQERYNWIADVYKYK